MNAPAVRMTEDPFGSEPPRSALAGFMSVTNTLVLMFGQLAEEVRRREPGTAALIDSYTESVAGQALDLIQRWPS